MRAPFNTHNYVVNHHPIGGKNIKENGVSVTGEPVNFYCLLDITWSHLGGRNIKSRTGSVPLAYGRVCGA